MVKLCLGTAQFGLQYGIANKTGKPSTEDIKKIINHSVNNGIIYFDTAQSYGDSEIILGKFFQGLNDNINLNVVTKLSPELDISDLKSVISSVNQSIKNLNINILYGLLAHRFESIRDRFFDNSIKLLKKNKLIKYSGVSVYTPQEALYALNLDSIDIIQIPFNIFDRRWLDLGVFEIASMQQKKIFVRSIFLQGFIFLSNQDLEKKNMSWALKYLKEFNKLVSCTPYSFQELTFMALKLLPIDVHVIMGVDNLSHLKDNLNTYNRVEKDKMAIRLWWENLPKYPERILNPTLW
jgi:aryl-alcohol dehydrogenase-like predicted oxidoreductase